MNRIHRRGLLATTLAALGALAFRKVEAKPEPEPNRLVEEIVWLDTPPHWGNFRMEGPNPPEGYYLTSRTWPSGQVTVHTCEVDWRGHSKSSWGERYALYPKGLSKRQAGVTQ